MPATDTKERRQAPLKTPTDLGNDARKDIAAALTGLLADAFALYLKTKNFHWHMSGPHFRDYHLLLDEQAAQIFDMTDPVAERARKLGGTTLRSIGHIARLQRIADNDADYVTPRTCWPSCARTMRGGASMRVGARRLRRARRRGDREPARELDRRRRAADLVPVRGRPPGGVTAAPPGRVTAAPADAENRSRRDRAACEQSENLA